MLAKLKAAKRYAESQHASSWVVGLALILGAVGIHLGLPRDAVYMASAGLVLISVPLVNAIQA